MAGIKNIPGEISPVQKQQKTQKQGGSDNGLFKETFDRLMEKTTDKPVATPPASSLGEIQGVNLTITETSGGVSEKTDGLLNLLDRYMKELTNPRRSLRDIEPLIQEVRSNAEELSRKIEQNSGEAPELKEIADRSALTANVEYIKFMRGDYL